MALATSTVTAALPVADTDRAKEFYSDRLGLAFRGTNAEGSLLYDLGGGASLMLLPREAGTQNPSTALTWEVADVVVGGRRPRGRAASFRGLRPARLEDGRPRRRDGGERAAWFQDPDGNVLCVHDRSALA